MRVLITVPRLELPGGVTNYYRALRGHLPADKVYFEIGARAGEASAAAVLVRFVADNWRFHRELARGAFDLVHINPSMGMRSIVRDGVLLLIARAHRRPVLVFFRGWDPDCAARIRSRHLRLFRRVYGRAAAFVVLGAEFDSALRSMGLQRPIFIATTVVDDALTAPAQTGPAPGATTGACDILYLSRLDRMKGLPEAIDAYARTRARWPATTLTIAGDGPERAAAEADVASRGLSGVRFLGHVDGADKLRAFRNADIFLFPTSFGEGMPNSVLEAMASGLAVITRPVGGIRDFFEDGRMGFVTASQDPAVFAELLDRLIGDPRLRHTISEYNRDYARKHFAAPVVVQRLLGIYEQVGMQASAR